MPPQPSIIPQTVRWRMRARQAEGGGAGRVDVTSAAKAGFVLERLYGTAEAVPLTETAWSASWTGGVGEGVRSTRWSCVEPFGKLRAGHGAPAVVGSVA